MNLLHTIEQLWFASRKVRLPIPPGALVLEVGSGDSPCPRSDVLFDLTLENHERVGGRTIADRPLVLGQAECLPFCDKAFDYVICFHTLEHSSEPDCFLREIERVGKAGYIETPSFWFERLNPLTMHRLEVGLEKSGSIDRLVINRKLSPKPDSELANQVTKSFPGLLKEVSPYRIVTRYFWENRIDFRIMNPREFIEWNPPMTVTCVDTVDPRPLFRRLLKQYAQYFRIQKRFDLKALLICPECKSSSLAGDVQVGLFCNVCHSKFNTLNGIPVMHRSSYSKPMKWQLK